MPTLTIDLSEEAVACAAALPPDGQTELTRRVQKVVAALSAQYLPQTEEAEDEEGKAWWASLTPQEQEEYQAKMAKSFADIDAGRTHPAEEVYARIRAKYAHLRTNQENSPKNE